MADVTPQDQERARTVVCVPSRCNQAVMAPMHSHQCDSLTESLRRVLIHIPPAEIADTALAEQRERAEAERDRHNAAYMKLATLVLDAGPHAKIHGMMAPEQAEAAVVRALKQIIARAAIRRDDA